MRRSFTRYDDLDWVTGSTGATIAVPGMPRSPVDIDLPLAVNEPRRHVMDLAELRRRTLAGLEAYRQEEGGEVDASRVERIEHAIRCFDFGLAHGFGFSAGD